MRAYIKLAEEVAALLLAVYYDLCKYAIINRLPGVTHFQTQQETRELVLLCLVSSKQCIVIVRVFQIILYNPV